MSVAFAVPLLALGAAVLISADKRKKISREKPKAVAVESFTDSQPQTVPQHPSGKQSLSQYSLTGEPINMKHNNMVPFYSGKLKGQLFGLDKAESILDNMVGTGSQSIRKTEQAPLFDPEEHVQWASGTPNSSDFYQSRFNVSSKSNNIKPFQSEMVGPGLNQGYASQGTGGFNSGMEAREMYMPKNVDEMRVATNPKLEYTIDDLKGPSYSHVQNLGAIGKFEKNRPDTFYYQPSGKWLHTTCGEKAPTSRPIEELHETARANQNKSYAGIQGPGNKRVSYAPRNFEKSNKTNLFTSEVGPCSATNRGPLNEISEYESLNNNRSTTAQAETFGSGFTNAIGAVVAPIMDMLSLTRRSDYVDNFRIYGDAGSKVPENYLASKNKLPVTIKETTLYTPPLGISRIQDKPGSYTVHNQQPITNQRSTNVNCSYFGEPNGGNKWGMPSLYAAQNQHNNALKESLTYNRINHGNMSIYSEPFQEYTPPYKHDSDRINQRMSAPTSLPTNNSVKELLGNNCKSPQFYNNPDRNEPSLLDAFRENPFTQSLSSVA